MFRLASADLLARAWELAGAHAPGVVGGCSGQGMLTPLERGSCAGGSLGGGGTWVARGWAPLGAPSCEEGT